MRTVPIGASNTGVFTVEGCKSGKPTALDLHLKCCIAGRNLKLMITGETVEKVKMAILPIYESLKIKNLQTAKDHKMAISRVFRQSRKEE